MVNATGTVTCNKALSLQSVVEVKLLYLTSTVPDAAYAKVSYTTNGGTVVDAARYEIENIYYSGAYRQQVLINTLGTADVSTKIICELFDKNDNLIEGTHVEYSIETYCYNQITKGRDIAPVCVKLMQAGTSARKYQDANKK